MSLTDDLQKLSELHRDGRLTEREYADAKRRTISDTPVDWPAPRGPDETRTAVVAASYKSSRWSRGNFLFPDRLTLAGDGIVFCKGAMFGSHEEHIGYRSIASFRTDNGVFLSTLHIETSGGSQTIVINGLWKSAARKIQDAIRAFQSRS
jgi:hypothetical protein